MSAATATTADVSVAKLLERDDSHEHRRSTASSVARFPVQHWSDIGLPNSGRYLVKGYVARGDLVQVFGSWGTSKSFAALDLAAHVAAGRSWMDCRVCQAGVAYVAAEGASGFAKRIGALKQVKFDQPLPLWLIPAAVPLLDPSAVTAIASQLSRIPNLGLIVLDTLQYAMTGGDENSPSDMSRLVSAVRSLQRSLGDPAIMLVHHSGHRAKERGRGHSSLDGSSDSIIRISSTGDKFEFRAVKAKDQELARAIAYELHTVELGTDEDGDSISSCVIAPVDEKALLLDLVRQRTSSVGARRLVRLMQESSEAVAPAIPKCLQDGLAAAGQPPLSPDRVVYELGALKRAYMNDAGQHSDAKPDSVRRGFCRAFEALKQADIVHEFSNWAWVNDRLSEAPRRSPDSVAVPTVRDEDTLDTPYRGVRVSGDVGGVDL